MMALVVDRMAVRRPHPLELIATGSVAQPLVRLPPPGRNPFVELMRIELTTSSMPWKRSSQLSYSPETERSH
jgi:hypothetical protein